MKIKVREFFQNVANWNIDQYEFFETSKTGLCVNFKDYLIHEARKHEKPAGYYWCDIYELCHEVAQELTKAHVKTWKHYREGFDALFYIRVEGHGSAWDCYRVIQESDEWGMYDVSSDNDFVREYSRLRINLAEHFAKTLPETIDIMEYDECV